jgi:hypothetical protein
VLQFLFTEINYGGRVTDDKDRRLINTLISTFCAPQVLQVGYAFSPSGTYAVPGCETVAQVRWHVHSSHRLLQQVYKFTFGHSLLRTRAPGSWTSLW